MTIKNDIAISDSGFVFAPGTGESFTVNPIGAEIIQMLKEEKSVQQISERMLEKYNTDATTVEKDVNDFISMLRHFSLIETND
ncbi:MAG: PqqD family protein [Bacteroidetes bacterium]|nr:MAG: PqqD family protein [Bacteroidota bacterium]RLD49154.1 MAG: PqqD family protein [Bacteroidota bacterium]